MELKPATIGRPSHCSKCKFFQQTVFETETINGHGSWNGICNNTGSDRQLTKSRYRGCSVGEFSEAYENRNETVKCVQCDKSLRRAEAMTDGKVFVCDMECAAAKDKEDDLNEDSRQRAKQKQRQMPRSERSRMAQQLKGKLRTSGATRT